MNGFSRECRSCHTTVIASKEEDLPTLMDAHEKGAYCRASVEAQRRRFEQLADMRRRMMGSKL